MPVCELCSVERPSPCVGEGASRRMSEWAPPGPDARTKSERVILACPRFQEALRHARGPEGQLVFIVHGVSPCHDLCLGEEEVQVLPEVVRRYVPSFDVERPSEKRDLNFKFR